MDYKLLHPMLPVDEKTELMIKHSLSYLSAFIDLLGQKGKNPKIIVDNNTLSMVTPNSTMITALGYISGDRTLYCYSPTRGSMSIPVKKSLEEMTEQELREINVQKSGFNINIQMFVALKDYVVETK